MRSCLPSSRSCLFSVAFSAAVAASVLPRNDVDVFAEIPVNVLGPCESGPHLFHSISPTAVFQVAIRQADVASHVVSTSFVDTEGHHSVQAPRVYSQSVRF